MGDGTAAERQGTVVRALIPAAAVFLVHLRVLWNPLLDWDDSRAILQNPFLQSLDLESVGRMFTSTFTGNWIPLTWLSLALDRAWGGGAAWPFHLGNLLLHAINSTLVFLVCRRLLELASSRTGTRGDIRTSALLAAVLFAVHPLRVESVAWATERKDVLYSFFYLLAILRYLRYASGPGRRITGLASCLVLFALSLMSKPMAVTLPLVLLVLDHWPLARWGRETRRVLAEKIPFLLMSLAAGAMAVYAQSRWKGLSMTEEIPLPAQVLNAARSIFFYIGKTVFPHDLVPLYPYPDPRSFPFLVGGTVAVLAVTAFFTVCVVHIRRRPGLAAAWLVYTATLAPVLGIPQVGSQAAADRYTYLASVALFLPASVGLVRLALRFRIPPAGIVSVTVLLFGGLTVGQIGVWRSDTILWESVIRVYPDRSHFAHASLASAYQIQGRWEDALREYDRALALPPDWAITRNGRGTLLLEAGREEEGLRDLRAAIALDPGYFTPWLNLWVHHGRKGEYREALEAIRQARRIRPHDTGLKEKEALTLSRFKGGEAPGPGGDR